MQFKNDCDNQANSQNYAKEMMCYGKYWTKLFLEKNYSQREIADELKTSVSTINRRIKNFKIGQLSNVSKSNQNGKGSEQNSNNSETVFQKRKEGG